MLKYSPHRVPIWLFVAIFPPHGKRDACRGLYCRVSISVFPLFHYSIISTVNIQQANSDTKSENQYIILWKQFLNTIRRLKSKLCKNTQLKKLIFTVDLFIGSVKILMYKQYKFRRINFPEKNEILLVGKYLFLLCMKRKLSKTALFYKISK